MSREREIAGPQILFHESLLAFPYRISVSPQSCVCVLKVAGVQEELINRMKIIITAEPTGSLAGCFSVEEYTIGLFAGDIGNCYRDVESFEGRINRTFRHESKHAAEQSLPKKDTPIDVDKMSLVRLEWFLIKRMINYFHFDEYEKRARKFAKNCKISPITVRQVSKH